ncbi:MAG: hypothetical protein LDL24_05195 [Treponema sp.]|nr:hypothetical protein [Treponema sp.]
MKLRVAGCAVLFALLLAGCAGGPAAAANQTGSTQAPSWTMETPAPSGGFTYFVGYADGPVNGEVQASEAATASLIAEIMRYIGVTITAESSATARSTLDSFQADLVQTVKQSSTNRVTGFQIAERYVQKKPNGVTVYILGKYNTKDLEAEMKRIAAVFQEKIDAVAVPEAKGKELLAAGDVIGAVRQFIAAASAASGSSIENAAIKFERNINNAREALALIKLEKLNDRLQANPGAEFKTPFRALISVSGNPISQAPIIVGYQSKLANGRMTTKTAKLLSGPDGVISFIHPSPDFVGKANLTMRLDLSAEMEALYSAGDKFSSLVAGLEDAIADKRITFEYTVLSQAKNIPTAVLIVDTDSAGSLSVGTTGSALLQTLSSNGFKVSAAALAPDQIAGKDDTAILAAAKTVLAGKAERFIYGTSRVVSVKDDKTQKIVTVSAEIKVVELASGRILYSSVKQVPGLGTTEKEAMEAARRQLGQKTIGEDLAAALP